MTADDPNLELRLASTRQDLLSAQRLRYRVFVQELGATGPMVDHQAAIEADPFDALCDHLILVDRRIAPESLNHVVGVYRLLPSDRLTPAAPRFYSEDEYDLAPLRASGKRLLELGRSCVDPAHRGGSAMLTLWNGLADYVLAQKIDILFGVASFHGTDPTALAQPLAYLAVHHLAPPHLRVTAKGKGCRPMRLIAPESIDRRAAMQAMPSLIKAYLRLGGVVGDGAFVDQNFNTTDVCLIMDTGQMSARHRAFYIRKSGQKDD